MNRTELQAAYDAIVAELGPYAAEFGLDPRAKVTGMGVARGDRSPTLRCRDMTMYRDGDQIFVHKLLPNGSGAEGVFIFDVTPDGVSLSPLGALVEGTPQPRRDPGEVASLPVSSAREPLQPRRVFRFRFP